MPTACAAINCRSRSDRKEEGVWFFRFPKDAAQRLKWAVAVRRCNERKNLWRPTPASRLCSKHFWPSDLVRFGSRKILKVGAVPGVFDFSKKVQEDCSDEEDGWSTYDAEKHKQATPMSIRRPTTGSRRRSRDKRPAARPRAHTSPMKTHRPGPACSKRAALPTGPRSTDAAGSSAGSSRAPAASHTLSSHGDSRGRESSVDAASVVDGPSRPERPPSSTPHVLPTSSISTGPVRRPCAQVSGRVQPRKKSFIPHSSVQDVEQTESDDSIIVEPSSGSCSSAKAPPPTSRTTTKPTGVDGKTPAMEQRTSSGRLSRMTPAAYVELSDDSDSDDPKYKPESDGDDVEDVTPQKVKEAYTTPDKSIQHPGRKLVQASRNPSSELFPSNPNPSTVQKETAPIPASAQSSTKGPGPELKLINRARAALFGYPCPICGKQHQTLTQATLHYYTHDVGESLFRCKICSATFSYWQPGHVRSEHPHVKPDEVFSQMENRFEQGKRNVARMILEKKNIDVGDMMDHVLDASSQLLKVRLPTVPGQQKEAGEVLAQVNQQQAKPDKKSAESNPKEQTIEQLREEYQRKRREKELKEEQHRKTLEELRQQYQNKLKSDQKATEQQAIELSKKAVVDQQQQQQQEHAGASNQPGSAPLTKTQELLSDLAKVRAQEEAKRNEEKSKREKLVALKSARIDKSVAKPLLPSVPSTGDSQMSRTAGAAPPKPSSNVHSAPTLAAGSSTTAMATEKLGPQRVLIPADGNRRFNTVQCASCNFRGIAAAVNRHAIWHTPEAERRSRKLPYRCTRCFYASSVSSHVQIHLVCVHFIDSTTAGTRTPPGSIDPSPMSEAAWKMARSLGVKTVNDGDKPSIGLRRFDCAFCDCFFMDQAGYHTHFQQWHIKPKGWNPQRPCPFENCFVEDSDGHSKWYHKAAPVRNRVCNQCGGTIYEGKEKQHKMASCHALGKVSEQLHFECPMPICGFGSNDQEEVTVHLAQCHSLWIRGLSGSRVVPYRCPRCGDAFEYKRMKDHVPKCTKEPPPKEAEQVPGPEEIEIDSDEPVRSVKQEPIYPQKPMVSIPASFSGTGRDTGGSRKPASSAQKRPYHKAAFRASASFDEDDPDIDREMDDDGPCSMPRGGAQGSKDSNALKDDAGEMKKKIVPKKEPAAGAVKLEKDDDLSEGDAEEEEHVEMSLAGFMGMTEYKAFVESEDDGRDMNGKYRCIFCPAVFETEKGLSAHRIAKHKIEFRAAKMFLISCVRPCGLLCPFCGFTGRTNGKWRFLGHLTRHSFGVPLSGLPDYIPTKSEQSSPPKKKKKSEGTTEKKPAAFQCMTCSACLPDRASLEVHVREHARKRQCDPAPQTGSAKSKVKR